MRQRHAACARMGDVRSAERAHAGEDPVARSSEAFVREPAPRVQRRSLAIQLGGRGWRALRYPNYRLYFFGQTVSQSGTWLQRIAQAWLVLDLADSPAALGVLTVFQFMPALLLSLVAGVVADRVGKQRLIIITSTLE